jgi:uncharacterized membrane-anchored protein
LDWCRIGRCVDATGNGGGHWQRRSRWSNTGNFPGKRALDISGEVVRIADIMNKNIALTGVLVVILLLSAIANLALCVRYVRTVNAAQRLQVISSKLQRQKAFVALNRSLMQSIANDAMEYSKKNSAMAALLQQYNPLLEQLNLAKPQQGTAPRQNK